MARTASSIARQPRRKSPGEMVDRLVAHESRTAEDLAAAGAPDPRVHVREHESHLARGVDLAFRAPRNDGRTRARRTYWAGDENSTWEAFRWSMLAGLSAASCGILYWGWDFAGFSGDIPDAELYLRSAAAAAFVPIMQYHSVRPPPQPVAGPHAVEHRTAHGR